MLEKRMRHHKLVLPEFMNEKGVLFGGYLLMWLDEFAYITASLHYPENRFVTVSLDNVVFKKPIQSGDILCFDVLESRLGNTSVTYTVKVYNEKVMRDIKEILFETNIVFVNVNESGQKESIKK